MEGYESLVEWRPPVKGSQSTFTEASLPPWEYFVMKSGDEGRAWVEEYVESASLQARTDIQEAISLLRRRRFEEAAPVLARAERSMHSMEAEHPDWAAVVGRWYFAATAYESYLQGHHEEAWNEVAKAQNSVQRVVHHLPYLLPFAHYCVEFRFLNARIARAQRHWKTLKTFYEGICELAAGRDSLLDDRDGRPVYYSTLDAYVLGLPQLTDEERRFLERILDHEQRGLRLRELARQLYGLDGILIPYP